MHISNCKNIHFFFFKNIVKKYSYFPAKLLSQPNVNLLKIQLFLQSTKMFLYVQRYHILMCIICTIFHHLSKATDTLLIMTEHPFGLNNYDSARRPWLMCTNKFIYCTSFLLSIYSCTEGYTNYKSIVLITPFDIL